MESCWRPAQGQGEPPSMEASSADWRSQLQPAARQRIVNKIMDTLRRYLSVVDPEGRMDIKKIAQQFEDKIFNAAVSQSEFLRKISFTMLSLETKTQQNLSLNSQHGVIQNSADTARTRPNVTDWQEEAYQKIQVMKAAYFVDLHEFNQKISHKLQQPDPMPHAKQSESYEKFKSFKVVLRRIFVFLQIPKSNITHVMKEKLPSYEKQIVAIVSLNQRLNGAPSQQQGHQQFSHPVGLDQNAPQHHPSQILQAQQQRIMETRCNK